MLKQESQMIDGLSFSTTQFPATRGLTLLGRLVKTIGPAMTALEGVDPQADIQKAMPVIAGALADLEPDAITALAVDVLANTQVIMVGQGGASAPLQLNTTQAIDLAFEGRLSTLFKAVGFAIKVNFADFFGGGVAPAAGAAPAAAPTTVAAAQ